MGDADLLQDELALRPAALGGSGRGDEGAGRDDQAGLEQTPHSPSYENISAWILHSPRSSINARNTTGRYVGTMGRVNAEWVLGTGSTLVVFSCKNIH